MGNPKQKWTSEEEEALRAGVKKHGTGKWKNIQRDPEFSHLLNSRSNIDLKVANFTQFLFLYNFQGFLSENWLDTCVLCWEWKIWLIETLDLI